VASSLLVSDFARRARQSHVQRSNSSSCDSGQKCGGIGAFFFACWSHLSHPKILKSNVKPSARPPFVGHRRAQAPPRHFGA